MIEGELGHVVEILSQCGRSENRAGQAFLRSRALSLRGLDGGGFRLRLLHPHVADEAKPFRPARPLYRRHGQG